ncbi:hypothetical protein [Metamycoplasma hominis]|uniref:hypothetical protein n=1 Tax=Metamycoplasma hominis TaxID=2098 RepID=UPI001F408565|nr:hypothetical protein [Metamycoplasma hominis]
MSSNKSDSDFIKSLPLNRLLMVAKVTFGNTIEVRELETKKCLRCWNHFEDSDYDDELQICLRCKDVIDAK